jgi:hypothetical protein
MLLGEGGCRRAVASSSDMMPWKRESTLREARTSCARAPPGRILLSLGISSQQQEREGVHDRVELALDLETSQPER